MTQDELAESVGVTPRHIQRVEAGSVDVTVSLLSTIAEVLDVDSGSLLRPYSASRRRRPGRPRKG